MLILVQLLFMWNESNSLISYALLANTKNAACLSTFFECFCDFKAEGSCRREEILGPIRHKNVLNQIGLLLKEILQNCLGLESKTIA